MALLPFVLFLDIDKTMIGRSHALTARFWLRKAIHEMGREGVLPAALARRCPSPTAEDAQVGPDLLRPGLGATSSRSRDAASCTP